MTFAAETKNASFNPETEGPAAAIRRLQVLPAVYEVLPEILASLPLEGECSFPQELESVSIPRTP